MRLNREILSLGQIDSRDNTYRITTNSNLENLSDSINRMGILNAPILEKKERSDTPYTIVSGFRRIAAAQGLGWVDFEAKIIDYQVTPLERVMIAICENSTQRPLNLLEISRALNMLSGFFPDIKSFSKIASELELPSNPALIDKIRKLCQFPNLLQDAVISANVPLSIALELGHMERDAAIALTALFCELKMGLNKQREILTLCKEIASREDRSVKSLIQDPNFEGIMMDNELDRTQKRLAIRKYLNRRRFPAVSQAEETFEKQKNALRLDKRIHLVPPLHFEGKNYTLKIDFSTRNELKDLAGELIGISDHPCLKKILSNS